VKGMTFNYFCPPSVKARNRNAQAFQRRMAGAPVITGGLQPVVRMKAISLWQPWASAIALGLKQIETRHWLTYYGGPIAIHAAQRWTEDQLFALERLCNQFPIARAQFDALLKKNGGQLPRGAIVAIAEMEDCVLTHAISPLTEMERAWGDYSAGRYGWILRNVRPLETPIPMCGRQGLFNVEIPKGAK
jgi:activating signal cointegrator 1